MSNAMSAGNPVGHQTSTNSKTNYYEKIHDSFSID
jgi:hypothetical protein